MAWAVSSRSFERAGAGGGPVQRRAAEVLGEPLRLYAAGGESGRSAAADAGDDVALLERVAVADDVEGSAHDLGTPLLSMPAPQASRRLRAGAGPRHGSRDSAPRLSPGDFEQRPCGNRKVADPAFDEGPQFLEGREEGDNHLALGREMGEGLLRAGIEYGVRARGGVFAFDLSHDEDRGRQQGSREVRLERWICCRPFEAQRERIFSHVVSLRSDASSAVVGDRPCGDHHAP